MIEASRQFHNSKEIFVMHWRRIGILLVPLVLYGSVDLVLAQDKVYSVGGGIAADTLRIEGGRKSDLDGVFVTFNFRHSDDAPSFIGLHVSTTDADETITVDLGSGPEVVDSTTELTRIGFDLGFMWRRESIIRPFALIGLSWVDTKVTLGSVSSIEDGSVSLIAGAGAEIGKGHHAFYFRVSYDPLREVDATGIAMIDVTILETQAGYVFRF
jgi:hypothetical protein